jgi:hypothetical protein
MILDIKIIVLVKRGRRSGIDQWCNLSILKQEIYRHGKSVSEAVK